jgi:hypothetical protein
MADGSGLPFAFDWKNPDYVDVFDRRTRRLQWLRGEMAREIEEGLEPTVLPTLRRYYRDHPADFINDWGVTVDPRNLERDLPAVIPFLLFPKQREFVDFVMARWRGREPGLVEKSRDMGMSWLTVAFAATLCLHIPGMAIGFGSRKEEYVDGTDNPKSLFWKARQFVHYLPREFRGGWDRRKHAAHMRLAFPLTGATMTGEAGDNIGRGDRTAIYFVDEAAHVVRPQLIEASLSQTTNCRIDLSSVNGMANAFAARRWGGKIKVFIFDWRDDPRKDDAWYLKQQDELDPVVLAQEVDRDYTAAVERVLIPGVWVRAAIDAHRRLELLGHGRRRGSLDVADEGADRNAFIARRGVIIDHIESWSGKGSDTFATTEHAFFLADTLGLEGFKYDADGIGSACRGDARVINERRVASGGRKVEVLAYRGSAGVIHPEREDVKGRLNEDFFMNRKAQDWWRLRQRFQATYRAIEDLKLPPDQRRPVDINALISISSEAGPAHLQLVAELSQPTFTINVAGKVVVDKKPDGAKSPNLADGAMMEFAEDDALPIVITDDALAKI